MMANTKPVNLALQGGGAHGAFTWGVLDKLLEDGRIDVKAISATSAGAMNAVVFAHGLSIGGPEGARAKLEEFWREISSAGQLWSPVRTSPWEQWAAWWTGSGFHSHLSPSFLAFQAMTHIFSPYQLNPLNFNPLKSVLEKVVDFDHLCQCPVTSRLFLGATNVRTGKVRIFENSELSADAVLASACLPYVFKAVEIDGEAYWDGGYMGNPAIYPLIYHGASRDVVIVHINPLVRKELPVSSPAIFDRINEISFNSSLMREMRAIAFVTRLIDDGALDNKKYHRMLVHSISDDEAMSKLGVATKLNPDWKFLCHLRDTGRASAESWLDAHFGDIGERSSIDVGDVYL
ncbi:MAG: patatin-like phospholipase family protein [Hyphomicrobiaceae bacterium]